MSEKASDRALEADADRRACAARKPGFAIVEESSETHDVVSARWSDADGDHYRAIVVPKDATEGDRRKQLATLMSRCRRSIEAGDRSTLVNKSALALEAGALAAQEG